MSFFEGFVVGLTSGVVLAIGLDTYAEWRSRSNNKKILEQLKKKGKI